MFDVCPQILCSSLCTYKIGKKSDAAVSELPSIKHRARTNDNKQDGKVERKRRSATMRTIIWNRFEILKRQQTC